MISQKGKGQRAHGVLQGQAVQRRAQLVLLGRKKARGAGHAPAIIAAGHAAVQVDIADSHAAGAEIRQQAAIVKIHGHKALAQGVTMEIKHVIQHAQPHDQRLMR